MSLTHYLLILDRISVTLAQRVIKTLARGILRDSWTEVCGLDDLLDHEVKVLTDQEVIASLEQAKVLIHQNFDS